MKRKTGAGLILFRKEGEKILFCCLEDKKGKNDLPKGTLDFGETVLECAKREAFEEANLKKEYYKFIRDDENNIYYINQNESLILFLCKLKNEHINKLRIKRNPHTKRYEHKELKWLSAEEIESRFPSYLKGSVFKALEIINNLS